MHLALLWGANNFFTSSQKIFYLPKEQSVDIHLAMMDFSERPSAEKKISKLKKNDIIKKTKKSFTKKKISPKKILKKSISKISKKVPLTKKKNIKEKQKKTSYKAVQKNNQNISNIKTSSEKTASISSSNNGEKKISHVKKLGHNTSLYTLGSRHTPLPVYPRVARMRHYQGRTEINIMVNKKGQVVKISLYKSSGYSMLDQSALRTLKKWTFSNQQFKKYASIREQYLNLIVPIEFRLR